MRDGLMPRLVRPPAPVALATVPAPEPVPATVVHTLERVIEKADAPKRGAWRFDVIRGSDNLIESIIATPVPA